MLIILGDRKTGRTTKLIEMSAEAESKGEVNYIVVRNHDQAYRISKKAQELDLKIGFPITFSDFLEGKYYSRNIDYFLIDNADQLLQVISSVPIKAITMEKSESEEI